MIDLRYRPLPSEQASHLQAGSPDAYGNLPERRVSDGAGVPCRHCLRMVEKGKPYLVLAYRPFSTLQPYAETGPIFLHAEPCPAADEREFPPMLLESPDFIVRGYGPDERIVYGTGRVVPTDQIASRAGELFAQDDVAFIHVRSARNNCYQCRIERG